MTTPLFMNAFPPARPWAAGSRWRWRRACLAAAWTLLGAIPLAAEGPTPPPMTVRLTWGGGSPRCWTGTIQLIEAGGAAAADGLRWQTLVTAADAAAAMHGDGGTIRVHEPRPLEGAGVEIEVDDWQSARLVVRLAAQGGAAAAAPVEVAVADLVAGPLQQPLDADGNRLVIRRAAGEMLPVVVEPSRTVCRPGDAVRLTVHPLLPPRSSGQVAAEIRLQVRSSPAGDDVFSRTVPLREIDAAAERRGDPQRTCRRFEPVPFEVTLPARESAYDFELEVVERSGLRWTRPLASRTIQFVAVSDRAAPPRAEEDWAVVHELDPGSPRLHERLRRMPGVGGAGLSMPTVLPSMRLPQVSLPPVNLPQVNLPQVNLPHVNLPQVNLPGVSVPSVSAMVPRLSGLLGSGCSVVEPHELGPMLRLPPARSADEPSWEGIVVASVQPGMPHLVEIEYPRDQEAVFGVSVLEANAAGTVVQSRHSGGFEVHGAAPGAGESTATGLHRFVFWPTTRNPLLLLSNPSLRHSALFGRVRVLAGPSRLPPMHVGPSRSPRAGGDGSARRVLAWLPTPDFSAFGAVERVDVRSGRSFADWHTVLGGVRRSAEWLSAQGVAGAMVGVYAEGAAIWPSRLTLGSHRWDSGAVHLAASGGDDAATDGGIAGLDPLRKDMLEVLCRVYAREDLRLVPAVCFDGAIPRLESIISGTSGVTASRGEAAGIVCVGRDGRPRAVDEGSARRHYNILDPRVQQAAEELVRELAGRLRGAAAVRGMAVVLPHDGWLQLPGVAWGLDDATFSRFLGSIGVGVEEPSAAAEERFARRAALVEGPLRRKWLEWRAGVVAGFYGRLADVLAEHDPRWSLYVVPTTLFSSGELAGRFRPSLVGGRGDTDVMADIGLDPAQITAHGSVVFVSPHVHGASDQLVDRSTIANSNGRMASVGGASPAARRGVIAVEKPVDLEVRQVLPHGPFGNASAGGPFRVHAVATGAERCRFLAESLVASDVEVVFDMGLSFAMVGPEGTAARRSLESLPAGGVDLVDRLSSPLVVRTRTGESGTWVNVVNACGTACRAVLSIDGRPASMVDVADGSALPVEPGGGVSVALGPWGVRTVVIDGIVGVREAKAEFSEPVRAALGRRLEILRSRRAVLETPAALEVLDNPGFELPQHGTAVAGWELVEPKRGRLSLVGATGDRAAVFSSVHGLSTLRSNPFSAPATGRVSIAMRLRLATGDAQPPLRIALEAVQDDREYYRFAAVGGLAGGRPLGTEWSQFVLQVADLPPTGLESLRVRLDLLGPGTVQIDDVRIFDLAFDEQQRVQLSKQLALLEGRLAAGDVGGCLVDLDSYWPRFLEEFVTEEAVLTASRPAEEFVGQRGSEQPRPAPAREQERAGGMLDRVRRWWQ